MRFLNLILALIILVGLTVPTASGGCRGPGLFHRKGGHRLIHLRGHGHAGLHRAAGGCASGACAN